MDDKIYSNLEQKKPAKHVVNFRYISEVSDIYIRQNTLQVGTKKLTKYIVNFRFIAEVSYIHIPIYDKIHSKLEQKTPTKYVGNFQYDSYEQSRKSTKVSRDFRDIISRAKQMAENLKS